MNFDHTIVTECFGSCFAIILDSCSSKRAAFIWAEAVKNENLANQFVAVEIDGVATLFGNGWYKLNRGVTVRLGPETPSTKRGSYYLPTNNKSPFSKGPKGVESSSNALANILTLLGVKTPPELISLIGFMIC